MGGRDHSCEGCGRGGFNDPDGVCECSDGAATPMGRLEQVKREAQERRARCLFGLLHVWKFAGRANGQIVAECACGARKAL